MADIKQNDLWFNTINSESLCRSGGNGPQHPSQLYALKKYLIPGASLLDYGMGSATTYEALVKEKFINEFSKYSYKAGFKYTGVDVIKKNVEWCKERFPEGKFEVNPSLHKIDQPDNSFDVVYSRHVVDHMESFEKALDEHKRVAKELVIVVLWVPLSMSEEHDIKNIVDHRGESNEKTYEDEYTNSYSHKKVMDYLVSDDNWKLMELSTDIGVEVSGHDSVIVLKNESK